MKKELSLEEIYAFILEPGKELGTLQIQYSGGEFLLREDALDIIRMTVEMGYEIRILSNGLLITEDLLRTIKRIAGRQVVIVFGMNSVTDPQTQRDTRDVDCNVVKRAIDLCKKHGIRRHVNVNVGRHNMKDLSQTFEWLEDNRISFNRSPFVPRMSGKDYFDELGFSKQDMKDYIHPALRRFVSAYVSYTPFFLSPEVHAEYSGGNSINVTVPQNPYIGCWVGSWIAVSAEGNVSPCALLLDDLDAGNLRERSLIDIINDSEIFQNLLDRNKLEGKCGRCRYNKTCGGCRAMAYAHTGNYMAEDPTCYFEPEDEFTVSEHEEETNTIFKKYVRVARVARMAKRPEAVSSC